MRSLQLASSLLLSALLVAGHSGETTHEESGEGDMADGLCLNGMEVGMLCMKDSSLGPQMGQAFSVCMGGPPSASRSLEAAGLRVGPPPPRAGGKGKRPPPPPPCPTFNQTLGGFQVTTFF